MKTICIFHFPQVMLFLKSLVNVSRGWLVLHSSYLSWHTPHMGNYTIYVLVSNLLCHWSAVILLSARASGHREVGCRTHRWKKRKGDLTAPDQPQYSFHKISAHPTEHGSNRWHESLLFTHKQKLLLSGGPLGKQEIKEAATQEASFQVSPTSQSLVFSCVRETCVSFIKGRILYWGKNSC